MTKFEIEEKIVDMLKTVFDPEIPVNVYDLGLIYKIDVSEDGEVSIDMTLTALWHVTPSGHQKGNIRFSYCKNGSFKNRGKLTMVTKSPIPT